MPHADISANIDIGRSIRIDDDRVVLDVEQTRRASHRRTATCRPVRAITAPHVAEIAISAKGDVDAAIPGCDGRPKVAVSARIHSPPGG